MTGCVCLGASHYHMHNYTLIRCWHMTLHFNLSRATAVLAGALMAGSMLPLASHAVEIRNGRTVFEGYPLLTQTSQTSMGMRERYKFTIELPINAGEDLRTVTFRPVAGSSGLDFYGDTAKAIVNGETVDIAVTSEGDRVMEVTFDEAVVPGSTVTIQVTGAGDAIGPAMVGVLASADGANPMPYFMGCLPTN